MRKRSSFFVLLLSFVTTTLLFQNCGESFEASFEKSASSSLCKLSNSGKLLSPFENQKVILDSFPQKQGVSYKLGDSETQYGLIVDVPCLLSQSETPLFLNQALHLSSIQKTLSSAMLTVSLSPASSLEELNQEMEKSSCFMGLTEDRPVSIAQSLTPLPVNDPQSGSQDHLTYLGHSLSRDLQKDITNPVVVAVIDTGIDGDHTDLQPRMWDNGEGFHGRNFVSENSNTFDDNGHGTHVAGIVGAVDNNAYGTSGLTGDYVKLMALKALDSQGRGSESDIYDAIDYAINNGADVINLSIEDRGENIAIQSAITRAMNANIVVVTAAGNFAEEITETNLFAPGYLGAQFNGTINVASINTNTSSLSSFSNYSNVYAEIAAPGAYSNALSLSAGVLSTAPNDQWSRLYGTSQAAPMVSAAAAMVIGYLKTFNISYNNAGIESFIKSDGAAKSESLVSLIENGRILHMGFLAQNLYEFVNSNENPSFVGDVTTGNVCVTP